MQLIALCFSSSRVCTLGNFPGGDCKQRTFSPYGPEAFLLDVFFSIIAERNGCPPASERKRREMDIFQSWGLVLAISGVHTLRSGQEKMGKAGFDEYLQGNALKIRNICNTCRHFYSLEERVSSAGEAPTLKHPHSSLPSSSLKYIIKRTRLSSEWHASVGRDYQLKETPPLCNLSWLQQLMSSKWNSGLTSLLAQLRQRNLI